MKLLMKRAFTVVLAAVLLFGCGEDDNKTGGNELTPQENKAKLEQCAMEVLGKINPQDHKTLVETIDAFAYKADYGLFEDEIGPTPGEGIEPNPKSCNDLQSRCVECIGYRSGLYSYSNGYLHIR